MVPVTFSAMKRSQTLWVLSLTRSRLEEPWIFFVFFWLLRVMVSGDSGMYPYQRTPMGNPYIRPYKAYIVGTLLGVHPIVP